MSSTEKQAGHLAPAYAALLPGLQEAARLKGYALAVHGSLARDLDLIAVPWVEWARPALELVQELAKLVGGRLQTDEEKLHGRRAWTVTLEGAGFIDISVMPASPSPVVMPEEVREAFTREEWIVMDEIACANKAHVKKYEGAESTVPLEKAIILVRAMNRLHDERMARLRSLSSPAPVEGLPSLVGILAKLPNHTKEAVEAYGNACYRIGTRLSPASVEGVKSVATRTIRIPACAEHEGVHAITATVPWVCLECSGPRGEPFKGQSYDGSRRLEVDVWNNPCGHVEKYAAVRARLSRLEREAKGE